MPTHADFCRTFVESGPLVDVVRARLQARAEARGWHSDRDVAAHLLVGGERLEGLRSGGAMVFLLPATAREVRLCSDVVVPDDLNGRGDRRSLGLTLDALSIGCVGRDSRGIARGDARLDVGLHEVERDGHRIWRWTDGEAVLPADLWQGLRGTLAIQLDVGLGGVRAWRAGQSEALPDAQRTRLRLVSQRPRR